MSEAVVHFAGLDLQVGDVLRQRCSWCGALLIDYDLARIAVPEGQDPRPSTWPPGRLVAVDGGASWLLDPTDRVPAGSCADLDDAVTR